MRFRGRNETTFSPEAKGRARAYMNQAALGFAETLWPTRCAVCDAPGTVLCDRCRAALPYIDYWQACPRCGAPWGWLQCTECNELSLRASSLGYVPFDGCVSAVRFNRASGSVIRMHKDGGERRLADEMAFALASAIPPAWLASAVVSYIPATQAARVRRGFDHGEALGRAVASLLRRPCCGLFLPPRTRDQRALTRAERFANLAHAMELTRVAELATPPRVILVDDVITTSATLSAAAVVLRRAGATQVFGASFARVY